MCASHLEMCIDIIWWLMTIEIYVILDVTKKVFWYACLLEDEMSTIDQRPSIIDHRSSTIDHRSSIIHHRPSIIDLRSSIIDHRSSIIDHRPSTIDHRRVSCVGLWARVHAILHGLISVRLSVQRVFKPTRYTQAVACLYRTECGTWSCVVQLGLRFDLRDANDVVEYFRVFARMNCVNGSDQISLRN